MVVVDPRHRWADARNFLADLWDYLGLPPPTPIQYAMMHFLQTAYGASGLPLAPDEPLPSDGQRKLLEALRGIGKSYVTSGFVCWCHWWNINLKIMVVSGGQDRAEAFTQFCLRILFDWEPMRHLFPNPKQRQSNKIYDINGCKLDHSPSLKSVGITGQLVGSRADIIIADDVETKTNCQTQVRREQLIHLTSEFENIIKPLPTSQIIYLGTPHDQDSLYNYRSSNGYVTQIYPARIPDHNYEGNLAPIIQEMAKELPVGTPTEPTRFNEETLQNKEMKEGKSNFLMQFMLNTNLEDLLKFPLKCSDLIVMDTDNDQAPVKVTYGSDKSLVSELPCLGLKGDRFYTPRYTSDQYEPYTQSIMYIDPSGRGKDRTGYAVVKFLRGYFWITRAGSLDGGYDAKTLSTLAYIAKSCKVHEVFLESNFGDGMFTELFKPVLNGIYQTTLTEERVGVQQKELRIIDVMEPLLNNHRLVIDPKIIKADAALPPDHQLIYQLSRLTRDRNSLKHDDALDALAGALRMMTKLAGVDVETNEDKVKQERFQEELDKWMAGITGDSRSECNWLSNM